MREQSEDSRPQQSAASCQNSAVYSPLLVRCCSAEMVWSRERDTERPPLSVILPRLYLGAESDVTQVTPGVPLHTRV